MTEKRKITIKAGICVFLSFLILAALTHLLNWYRIDIRLNGEETVIAEYGNEYFDEGARVEKVAVLFPFFRQKYPFEVKSDVDVNNIGKYSYTYTAEFNGRTYEKTRTVKVKDHTPPVITLISTPDYYTLPNHSYKEEGYMAMDLYDGDLTDKVIREDWVDYIIYRVSDNFGNTAEVIRDVIYDDRDAPVISYLEYDYIPQGASFNNGFKAVDDADGDLTNQVVVEGSVNTAAAGDYQLKYSVSDSSGHVMEVERTVHVVPYNSNKLIYLTFDDGPSAYTSRLLDILKKYKVKATFFVTCITSDYSSCIKRAYNEGHAIGVHSYTHNYAKIYASTEAYWEDFNRMNNVIRQQTGHTVTIFRFPGGSSNTVSKNYCTGIMTTLARQAAEKGYVYFDWNVESGDAGRTTDPDKVVSNLISGTSKRAQTVALCHDSKSYTVEGIEKFLQWALQNGYSFAILDRSSPKAHHGIAN